MIIRRQERDCSHQKYSFLSVWRLKSSYQGFLEKAREGIEPGPSGFPPTSRARHRSRSRYLYPDLDPCAPDSSSDCPCTKNTSPGLARTSNSHPSPDTLIGRFLRPEHVEICPNTTNTWPQEAGQGPTPLPLHPRSPSKAEQVRPSHCTTTAFVFGLKQARKRQPRKTAATFMADCVQQKSQARKARQAKTSKIAPPTPPPPPTPDQKKYRFAMPKHSLSPQSAVSRKRNNTFPQGEGGGRGELPLRLCQIPISHHTTEMRTRTRKQLPKPACLPDQTYART